MLAYSRIALSALILSAFAIGALVSDSEAGACRRKAFCKSALSDYEYQWGVAPTRGTVASSAATAGAVAPDQDTQKKVFQPLENELTVGDCSLSGIRLQLYSDGQYLLGFRATNTAKPSEIADPSAENKTKTPAKKPDGGVQAPPVRHHRVFVVARLYSSAQPGSPRETKRVEGVLLREITAGPFFLTAQEQRTFRFFDTTLTRRQFNEATQVEFELEVDPVLGPLAAKQKECGCR